MAFDLCGIPHARFAQDNALNLTFNSQFNFVNLIEWCLIGSVTKYVIYTLFGYLLACVCMHSCRCAPS